MMTRHNLHIYFDWGKHLYPFLLHQMREVFFLSIALLFVGLAIGDEQLTLHPDTETKLCSTVLMISDKKYPIVHENLQHWLDVTPPCTKIYVKPLLPSSIESRQKIADIAKNNTRVTIIESIP